jgi:UDP-N-acetylglucosamine 2-epimerase (non-hydrolysing)
MKVLTIAGTRPELIRLCLIIQKLDKVCDHILVYTNQNYDPNLSTIFFQDLGIREPNYTLTPHNGIGNFLGYAFIQFEHILNDEKPDKVLVLGDTNSGLLAVLAAKKGIPVYHMEAGNRCYDGDVPEETNRRVIDACSMFNLPYTENSKQNLINERFHKNFIFKIGNPIAEVLYHYMGKINESQIDEKIGLSYWDEEVGMTKPPFALLTFHRTENVDNPKRVKKVLAAMKEVAKKMPVIYPLHPRSKDQFEKQGIDLTGITCIDPIGLFDFVKLEKLATIVFTDSGTVPEETSLFGTNTVVLRNTTERQELMENGTLILAGTETESILNAYNFFLKKEMGNDKVKLWSGLEDYDKLNVSDTVVRLLMGQNFRPERMGHDEY